MCWPCTTYLLIATHRAGESGLADFIRQKRMKEQIQIKVRTRYPYQILKYPGTTVHADVQFKYKAVCAHTQNLLRPPVQSLGREIQCYLKTTHTSTTTGTSRRIRDIDTTRLRGSTIQITPTSWPSVDIRDMPASLIQSVSVPAAATHRHIPPASWLRHRHCMRW